MVSKDHAPEALFHIQELSEVFGHFLEKYESIVLFLKIVEHFLITASMKSAMVAGLFGHCDLSLIKVCLTHMH